MRADALSLFPGEWNDAETIASMYTIGEMDQYFWKRGIEVLVGVDEVGRGPLAGPVVAAAVVLDPLRVPDGLDDSKKLSAVRRKELYRALRYQARAIAVGVATPQEIDRLNILEATRLAMRRALYGIALSPQAILIDALKLESGYPEFPVIKGDQRSLSIAAASIVAKVIRDEMMTIYDRMYPGYGFKDHAGYPTRAHRLALLEQGPSRIHRRSFRLFPS
ncbi:MAG: ribonuclease HII [Candidatus Carbobacillus altaicus]|uniref:Ribonuclease HII n=1 Tax=Candidatus Carbonibacillus altaicus TaxID=2163959 RepID=A0A2R6Y4Y5_9BACL|nr:ribonuclease HII [Candidatus Carbobacillus altaicus]PTQ57749.1 MAG: Ribonuclease HII [Candidatus Carbobacillus altaicus]